MKVTLRDVVIMLVAIAIFASAAYFRIVDVKDRRKENVDTAYALCLSIEDIKSQIHLTIQDSMDKLPTVPYYRTHPRELVKALEDTRKTRDRFAAQDCDELPLVKRVR